MDDKIPVRGGVWPRAGRLRGYFVAYDVFISYSSKDKVVADAVCARLEAAGIRCWIAPRDIVAGTSYGEAIIDAIHGAKVMVLVFSSSANSSGHIPKEVERAVSNSLAILPFRIEDVAPGKSLDYFIGSVHWLDAMTPPMENHLDALAATVHKLLPVRAGEHGVPAGATSGVWQRSAPAVVAPVTPPIASPTAARETTSVAATASGVNAHASSSRTIWIIGTVAVVAVVVMAAIFLRGGGAPASDSASSALLPGVISGSDAIVGCYQWFNNAPVVIRPDHTMAGGPFTASWQLVNRAERAYTFTWSEQAADTVAIAANQRSLRGGNQYGGTDTATRLTGSSGLIGTWAWSGLVRGTLTVNPDGTFLAAPATGKWQGTWEALDPSRGIYRLTASDFPKDSVTLSADRSHLAGMDQYGIAISGVRTEPCPVN